MGKTVTGDKVTVNGSETYDLVDCETFSVNGATTINGDLHANRVNVNGSATIGGNLDAHEVTIKGSATIDGSVVASEATFMGSASVGELTDVTDLSIRGAGTFQNVIADEFDLILGDTTEADSVRATNVKAGRQEESSFLKRILNVGSPIFEVGVVEGETVDLDDTRAETIVGKRVTLGSNVEVDTVYVDELDAPDSTIGEVRDRDEY
ncbi:MAG: hypothetical protein ABEI52_11425 [Halobacteriaceae archaeon]